MKDEKMSIDLAALGGLPKTGASAPGESSDNPFIIVAIFTARAVGDFIILNTFASSVKKLFRHAKLYVYCRDDRGYKRDILEMNSYIDDVFLMPGEAFLAIDNFGYFTDIGSMGWEIPKFITRHAPWHKYRCNAPHLILSPSIMEEAMLGSFEHPGRLRIPEDKVDGLTARLIDKGVDPDRWFSVIHYREPTYEYRPARRHRDASPEPHKAVTSRIINELGGQVIRVGHPGMTEFPAQKGFIDLALEEDDIFYLQAFAMSRARFMLGVSSGPLQVTSAFGTPTVSTNCITPFNAPGCWNDHDLCLHRNIFLKDGTRVSAKDAMDNGLYNRALMVSLEQSHGITILENSSDELFQAALKLHAQTLDTEAWRVPVQEPDQTRDYKNQFPWPIPTSQNVPVIEFPDLAREAYKAFKST